jgi:hypothetical protein
MALARKGMYASCHEDHVRICPHTRNIRQCLLDNRDKLSSDCSSWINEHTERTEPEENKKPTKGMYASCHEDHMRICPHTRNIRQCLIDNRDRLSSDCSTWVDEHTSKSQPVENKKPTKGMYGSCHEDHMRICPHTHNIYQCLLDNREELSSDCTLWVNEHSKKSEPVDEEEEDKLVMHSVSGRKLYGACHNDHMNICPDVMGQRPILKCLFENRDKLAEKCSTLLEDNFAVEESEKHYSVKGGKCFRNACHQDHLNICPDIHGKDNIVQCFVDNKDSLSAKCAVYIEKHLVEIEETEDSEMPLPIYNSEIAFGMIFHFLMLALCGAGLGCGVYKCFKACSNKSCECNCGREGHRHQPLPQQPEEQYIVRYGDAYAQEAGYEPLL